MTSKQYTDSAQRPDGTWYTYTYWAEEEDPKTVEKSRQEQNAAANKEIVAQFTLFYAVRVSHTHDLVMHRETYRTFEEAAFCHIVTIFGIHLTRQPNVNVAVIHEMWNRICEEYDHGKATDSERETMRLSANKAIYELFCALYPLVKPTAL